MHSQHIGQIIHSRQQSTASTQLSLGKAISRDQILNSSIASSSMTDSYRRMSQSSTATGISTVHSHAEVFKKKRSKTVFFLGNGPEKIAPEETPLKTPFPENSIIGPFLDFLTFFFTLRHALPSHVPSHAQSYAHPPRSHVVSAASQYLHRSGFEEDENENLQIQRTRSGTKVRLKPRSHSLPRNVHENVRNDREFDWNGQHGQNEENHQFYPSQEQNAQNYPQNYAQTHQNSQKQSKTQRGRTMNRNSSSKNNKTKIKREQINLLDHQIKQAEQLHYQRVQRLEDAKERIVEAEERMVQTMRQKASLEYSLLQLKQQFRSSEVANSGKNSEILSLQKRLKDLEKKVKREQREQNDVNDGICSLNKELEVSRKLTDRLEKSKKGLEQQVCKKTSE